MRRFAVIATAGLLPLGLLPGAEATESPSRAPLALPNVVPVAPDALTEALDEGQLSGAEYALHRARSVFTLGEVRQEFGEVERVDPHAATLILRDLALRLNSLEGEERELAVSILQRPSQGGSNDGYLEYTVPEQTIETPHFRIHYVTRTEHESTLAFATEVSLLMEEVWTKEVELYGWLPPKPDGGRGGDDRFDVYLGNVGAHSIYGYCSTDPGQSGSSRHSYCVLDNGFTEFPNAEEAAKVTAAHEFHHALQFTYDSADDYWLAEATATWMEDEVFDAIDDNYQYLRSSSLARPQTPADTWTDYSDPRDPDTGFQYGQFIWMRYLSEKAADPAVIRNIWEETAKPGAYSLLAIQNVLGGSAEFASSFAHFAAVNSKASRFYAEGAAYEAALRGWGITPPRHGHHLITPGATAKGGVQDVDHLASRYISFTPGTGVASAEQLTVAVDMGSSPMQKASLVSLAGTTMTVREIDLIDGEGHLTIPFGDQAETVLVLTNASNRMTNCSSWMPGDYSCGGSALDDDRTAVYSAVTGSTLVDPGDPVEGGTQTGPRVQNFKANPDVFSPNGDGRKDKTKIIFDLLDNASVTLSLIKNGTVLRRFARNQALEGGYRYGTVWDGKSGGRVVKNGTYTLKLKAVTPTGTTTKKTSVTVRR